MSEMETGLVHLTIDGQPVAVPPETTILNAAKTIGITIPTLCYLSDQMPDGSCRFCVVEVDGGRKKGLMIACAEHCTEGMIVQTESKEVIEARKFILEMLLSRHCTNCFTCPQNGKCKLQEYCYRYDVKFSDFGLDITALAKDESNPFISYDPNLCIMCRRCERVCENTSGRNAISIVNRGYETKMGFPFGKSWSESTCESCGNCVAACPTGALTRKEIRKEGVRESNIDKKVLTSCPHCATGCQYYLLVKDNKIVGTEAYDGPANHGMLCVKGRFGSYNFVHAGDRVKYPLIKNKATGQFERATWDEALDLVASKFMEIKKKYGGDALAGFACSRSPNEDIYMVQKMVRTCFGTNNVDNCARVCHSASVAGLAKTLGSGAMTNPIYDITHDVDAIMLVGSNPEEAHPVVGMQIRQAVARGTKLIVVDPRDIDLAKKATIHLKLKPGTNIAFALGMMNVFITEDLVDKKFIAERTEGYEELKAIALKYPPEKVAEICHINADDLRAAARLYATANKAPIIYCLGVTEHSTGTEGVMSMSNMAMMVGKLGRSGCGVNPLRGQNNVQGACDMGALPTDFPGYQKVANEEVMAKFEKAWGVELNHKVGLHATDVFPAAIEGKVKGLYIYGEDPVVTDPDTNHIIKALKSLDFFVMQELFITKTAEYADVILPGVSYAEKEGTFSNTERRVIRVRKAIEPCGEQRLDTDIIIDLMNRMGYKQPYMTAAEIMDEIASVTPSFGGISHARLDSPEVNGNGLQWPCPTKDHPGTPIMHVGKFSRGLGLFYPADYVPSAELPDDEYPTILMTGRILYHYCAGAMTHRTPGLMEIVGESYIEINEQDAAKWGVADGDKVKITSRRGETVTTARVGDKCSPGESWMPFHFGDCNWVTNNALDQFARIPEYKVCAVKIAKA